PHRGEQLPGRTLHDRRAWTDHHQALCTEQWDRSTINGGALGSSGAAALSRCSAGANGLPQSLALVVRQAWFTGREPLAGMQGPPLRATIPGYTVRQAVEEDLTAGNRVCTRVHGHDRSGELRDAIQQGTATVVEHDGRITGYATAVGWFAHAVGESNEEL